MREPKVGDWVIRNPKDLNGYCEKGKAYRINCVRDDRRSINVQGLAGKTFDISYFTYTNPPKERIIPWL